MLSIIFRSVLLRLRNVSEKIVEKVKTHILGSIIFFFFENIMRRNIVRPERPHITIWRIRIACWTPKSKNTHSEKVILINCPLQQWLHKHNSLLPHTYTGCLAFIDNILIRIYKTFSANDSSSPLVPIPEFNLKKKKRENNIWYTQLAIEAWYTLK